jgi:GNAT superfamily N-acetyltransferase
VNFRTIDVKKDRETIIEFRKESYLISFGSVDRFGDEETYVNKIAARANIFPEGQVLVEQDNRPIGQMELQVVLYDGRKIGYTNLYYLIPEYRGKGYGSILMDYSERFFLNQGMAEYHLRVSPTNERALRFYLKSGMKFVKEEKQEHVVLRMAKKLQA